MALFSPEMMELIRIATENEKQEAIDRRWQLERQWDEDAERQAAQDAEDARREEERKLREDEELKRREVEAAADVTAMREPEPEEVDTQYGYTPAREPMMA